MVEVLGPEAFSPVVGEALSQVFAGDLEVL
jgi:hypothetical protein